MHRKQSCVIHYDEDDDGVALRNMQNNHDKTKFPQRRGLSLDLSTAVIEETTFFFYDVFMQHKHIINKLC